MTTEEILRYYEIGRLLDFDDEEAKVFAGIAAGYSKKKLSNLLNNHNDSDIEVLKALICVKLGILNKSDNGKENFIKTFASKLSEVEPEDLQITIANIQGDLTPSEMIALYEKNKEVQKIKNLMTEDPRFKFKVEEVLKKYEDEHDR